MRRYVTVWHRFWDGATDPSWCPSGESKPPSRKKVGSLSLNMAACEPYSGLKESYSACFCLTQCARFISNRSDTLNILPWRLRSSISRCSLFFFSKSIFSLYESETTIESKNLTWTNLKKTKQRPVSSRIGFVLEILLVPNVKKAYFRPRFF